MRRICLILCIGLLLVPAAAFASSQIGGDGSAGVNGIDAKTITIQGRGIVFGYVAQGALTVLNYDPDGLTPPQIATKFKLVGDNATVRYSGSGYRFMFPSGKYSLKFEGTGIAISAVGSGKLALTGIEADSDGTLSVNGKAVAVTKSNASVTFGTPNQNSSGD